MKLDRLGKSLLAMALSPTLLFAGPLQGGGTSTDGTSSGDPEPACRAQVIRGPYESFNSSDVDVRMGYNGWAADYLEEGQLLPEAFPLTVGLISPELDEVMFQCTTECEISQFPAPQAVSWSVELNPFGDDPQGAEVGGFLNHKGKLLNEMKKRDSVVYQPPHDLEPGETRELVINAVVWDPGNIQAQKDHNQVLVVIEFEVSRDEEPSYYNVETTNTVMFDIGSPGGAQLMCPDPAGECCTLTSDPDIGGGVPSGTFVNLPTALLTEVVRPITFRATGGGIAGMECGFNEPNVCSHSIGSAPIQAGLEYSWVELSNSANADIIRSPFGGNTIFVLGNNAGTFEFELNVVNMATGGVLQLGPQVVNFYEFNYISSQGSVDLPLVPLAHKFPGVAYVDSYGLMPSRAGVSGHTMNGCDAEDPPGAAPTYAGPQAPRTDFHTYRTHIAAPAPVTPMEDYRVRVFRRNQGSNQFLAKYGTLENPNQPNGSKEYRSDYDFKITPVDPPSHGSVSASSRYDSEAGAQTPTKPDQTLLASIGEWLEAKLERSIDGGVTWSVIGSRFHPIGRIWKEGVVDNVGNANHPKSLRKWSAYGGFNGMSTDFPLASEPQTIAGGSSSADWTSELRAKFRRTSQILQQAGVEIKWDSNEVAQEIEPRRNALQISLPTGVLSTNGSLDFTIKLGPQAGNITNITVPLAPGQDIVQVGQAVRAALDSVIANGLNREFYFVNSNACFVFMDAQPQSPIRLDGALPPSGHPEVLIEEPTQTWFGNNHHFGEVIGIAANGRKAIGSIPLPYTNSNSHVPAFVLDGDLLMGVAAGVGGPPHNDSPLRGALALVNHVAIGSEALSGSFATIAHEVMHSLAGMDHSNEPLVSGNPSGAWINPIMPAEDLENLMFFHVAEHVYPESISATSPNASNTATVTAGTYTDAMAPQRLSSDQIIDLRSRPYSEEVGFTPPAFD